MIYVIHFSKPLHHARHYVGMVASHDHLERRMHEHRTGRGARILDACNRKGIPYRVVRTMNGGRIRERILKNRKNGPKLCPVCNPSINQQQKSKRGNRKYAESENLLCYSLIETLESRVEGIANRLQRLEGKQSDDVYHLENDISALRSEVSRLERY